MGATGEGALVQTIVNTKKVFQSLTKIIITILAQYRGFVRRDYTLCESSLNTY